MPPTPIVLMYHGIISSPQDVPPEREPGAGLYDVSSENFERQLRRLRSILDGRLLPRDRGMFGQPDVTLTFDDGEMNHFRNAFPLLKEFGFSAYFFVTAQRVGQSGYMGVAELQVLSLAGMTIGSHGFTHQMLTTLDDASLRREFFESKNILEVILQKPITSFSVPRGFYDRRVLALARESGYQEIFISGEPQAGEGTVGRLAVKADWTLERFDQALRHEVPGGEKLFNMCKGLAKKILGAKRYDHLRTRFVKEPQEC